MNYKERFDSKSRENAIGNKNKSNGWLKKVSVTLLACTLALLMIMPMLHADGGLEIGPEIVGEALRGTKEIDTTISKPTINPVAIGSSVITGDGLVKPNRRKKANGPCKIHVTVMDENSAVLETKTFSIGPKERPKKGEPQWSVTLDNGVQKGYKIVAQQELDGKFSDESDPYVVKELLATQYKDKLSMPTLEVWSEDVSVLEQDAVEDIVNAFLTENNKLAVVDDKNFEGNLYVPKKASEKTKAIDVSGDGKSITVTFSDGSKIENIPTNVIVKQITENSNPAEAENLTVVAGEIKGKISGDGPFKRARVTIVKFGNERSKNAYCNGPCTVDKNAKELATIYVDETTGEFTYKIKNTNDDKDLITLGKDIGITVKEYKKKNNCKTIQPSLVIPKVDVRDPKKITPAEKDKIAAAIRAANTTSNGTSKLPDGTGFVTDPAFIEISDDGKVKIISPNDVEVNDWDNDGNPIYSKNPDGTVVVSSGKENNVIHFDKPGELLSNLAPLTPEVKVEGGNVIVTPNKADTDASKVEITYTGKDGTEKKVTATKDTNGDWTTDDPKVKVDDKGVVTLPTSKVKSNTEVNAKVTDEGGIAQDDKDAKSSEAGSVVIKASVQKPTVTVDPTTGDVTVTPKDNDEDAKRLFITYTPANGTEKTVEAKKDNDGKWSITGESDFEVSADGKSFTIKNAKAKEKTKVTAITKGEEDSLVSGIAESTVPDKTAPKAPEVKVNTTDGSAEIAPPEDIDTKTVIVKYPDPSGTEKTVKATKDNNVWTLTEGAADGISIDSSTGKITIAYANMKNADTVSATAKDDSGNDSQSSTDTTLPPVPTVDINTDKDITVKPPENAPAVNGMEIAYTPAGASEAKTIKIVKSSDDKWKLDGDPIQGISVDQTSGLVTIKKGTAKDLSNVTAKSKIDETKIGLETAEKQVPDTTAPEAPSVKVQEDGSVTITPKEGSDTKTVTVTYKDQDGADKTATATKGDDNKWTVTGDNGETIDETTGVITIPTEKSNPGDKVIAKAKDAANNESGPSNDTTKPAPPTVTPDQESGNVTITPPTKGNLDGMDIEYETPTGEKRTLRAKKDADNKWKIEGENPDGVTIVEGTGLVTIPKGKAKEKTPVKADSTLGKLKTPDKNQGEQAVLVPDKTAPNSPTVEVDTKTGNITITPPKDEDTTSVTVNYKDKDGTEKTATATKDNNGWKMTKAENDETVDGKGVITILKGNYKTGEEIKAYGNDNVDNKSSEDNKTPVEVTFESNGGSKTMDSSILALGKGNDPQGQSAVLPAEFKLPECKFDPPQGKVFAGWQVGNETKKAGDTIKIKADTTIQAIWKDKPVPPTPDKPNPDQPSVLDREAGKDRIETSILISKQQYKKAKTVIIVRNDLYPDALTAGVLAKAKPAPILLTQSKMLDPRVEAEIRRLGATEIIIVGGKSAISLDVEKALAAYDSDTVQRLDGLDRFETATLVAREVAGLVDIRQTAIITTGENWPDALSASAFACKNNHPILLVRKNKIDQVVNRTMKDLKIGQVYMVGGPMAVSETVAKKLPKVITRIAGLNRYGTAKAVAEYGFKDAKGLYLASGEVYADALIIGPVAGKRNVPILLTQHKHLNAETKAYIEEHKPGWATIVGGTLRIGPEVEKELNK